MNSTYNEVIDIMECVKQAEKLMMPYAKECPAIKQSSYFL